MRPASLRRPAAALRRPAPLIAALASTLVLAACGGSTGSNATHSTQGATTPQSGRAIFSSAGCAGCHTLSAAGATGNVGPNLDELKPTEATVIRQVTDGGGVMPSFKGRLSAAQIRGVAEFVASATR